MIERVENAIILTDDASVLLGAFWGNTLEVDDAANQLDVAMHTAIHLRHAGGLLLGDRHPSADGPWNELYDLADRTEMAARMLGAVMGVESVGFDVMFAQLEQDHLPHQEAHQQAGAA